MNRGYARRTKEIRGHVNFPVDSDEFVNSHGGGLTVLLLVMDRSIPVDNERPLEQSGSQHRSTCFGPSIVVHANEVLIGDDQPDEVCINPDCPHCSFWRRPECQGNYLRPSDHEHVHFPKMHRRQRTSSHLPSETWDSRTRGLHQPNLSDIVFPIESDDREDCSIEYIAAVELGNTGWSGYSQDHGMWRCTYNDLSTSGKAIYNALQHAYPNMILILQTWLDT